MTKYNEVKILDGDAEVLKAKVITNTDEDTNLDEKNGVVASCIMYARAAVNSVKALLLDAITHSLVVIPQEHHEIHEENHYFIKTYLANGVGAATDFFAFTTPNTTKRIHAKVKLAPDVDYVMNIYEGSVITGGTPVAGINNDRDSANVAGLVTVAAPAHTTPGTVIWASRNGGGKDPVGVSPGANYEIIAATNTVYVFELVKQATSSAAVVDIDFWWYEHAPKS